MNQTIAELKQGIVDDNESLRLQIKRLETQILKGETIIMELDNHERLMAARKVARAPIIEIPSSAISVAESTTLAFTVPDMVNAVLPAIAQPFTYQDVIHAILQQYKGCNEKKVRIGVYPALISLKKKGAVLGDGAGRMLLKGAAPAGL